MEHQAEAAFVMEEGDRLHKILVCDGVRFQADTDAEIVITLFVIRRANGKYDAVNVNKTFQKDRCVSRTVQTNPNITAA